MKLKITAYNETYDEYVCENKVGDVIYVNPHRNSTLTPTAGRRSLVGKKYKLDRESQVLPKGIDEWVFVPMDDEWVETTKKSKKLKITVESDFYRVEL